MTGRSNRLAFILALIAGSLAWAAAAIGYARTGDVDWTPLAGGAFMFAFAFYLRNRERSRLL